MNEVAEIVFLVFFSLEMIMKIIAWGFFLDKRSYLRDGWNWLDFVVVVSAIVQLTGLGGGLSFLRLFRILRPLRSLNAVPQMKVLVNTVISSVPRLGYVSGIAGALFMIFGIIGTTVMDGMMYRGCRVTLDPVPRSPNESPRPQGPWGRRRLTPRGGQGEGLGRMNPLSPPHPRPRS